VTAVIGDIIYFIIDGKRVYMRLDLEYEDKKEA